MPHHPTTLSSPRRGLWGVCVRHLQGMATVGSTSPAPGHCGKALTPLTMAPPHPSPAPRSTPGSENQPWREAMGSAGHGAWCHFPASPVARCYHYCPLHNQFVLFLEAQREQRRFGERKRCFMCWAGRLSTMFIAFVLFWAKVVSFK